MKADADQVRALLSELSRLLLKWSWEGVVGYEDMVERVGRTYGYDDTTVIMEAQSAMISLSTTGQSIHKGINRMAGTISDSSDSTNINLKG